MSPYVHFTFPRHHNENCDDKYYITLLQKCDEKYYFSYFSLMNKVEIVNYKT